MFILGKRFIRHLSLPVTWEERKSLNKFEILPHFLVALSTLYTIIIYVLITIFNLAD
jgi:hypothetical protein